jgi:excisionase family DNA binding protein
VSRDELGPAVVMALEEALVDRYERLRVLTVPEVARQLGVSDRQVYRLINEGVLAETRPTRNRVGVTQAVLAEYIRKHTNGPT